MAQHRLFVKFLSFIFVCCLLGVALLAATNLVFGSRQVLKDSLAEGQIYDSVAVQTIEAATNHAERQTGEDIPLDNALVKKVATRVITGERLQGYGEHIVDGIYDWLDGHTEEPDFAIDLTPLKKDFADSVATASIERAQNLPPCTLAQMQQFDLNNLDLLSIPCLPPGINLDAEKQKLFAKTADSQNLFQDTTVSEEESPSESAEKPFEKLSYLPTIFQWSKILPWILGVLGIVSVSGIIFLYSDRRLALKKISKTLLVSGLVLLLIAGLLSLLFSKIRPNPEVVAVIELRDSILIVITSLGSTLTRALLIFAAAYAVSGTGGLAGLHFSKAKPVVNNQKKIKNTFSSDKNKN